VSPTLIMAGLLPLIVMTGGCVLAVVLLLVVPMSSASADAGGPSGALEAIPALGAPVAADPATIAFELMFRHARASDAEFFLRVHVARPSHLGRFRKAHPLAVP